MTKLTKLRHEVVAEKLQVKNYFYVEYQVLRLFGFDLYSRERPFYRPWYPVSTLFGAMLLMAGMLHYTYANIKDIKKASDALAPFVQGLMTIWKAAILFWKRKEIVDLVDEILRLTENANDEDIKILTPKNRRPCTMNKLYCYVVLNAAFFSSFSLPLYGIASLLYKGEFEYKLPLVADYPVKWDNLRNYFIIFALQMYSTFGVIFVFLGMDVLFSWIAHSIAAQFNILQKKITSLAKNSNDEELRSVIQFHQRTIELADRFNDIFKLVAFAEFSMNSVQIALAGYQVVRGVEFSRALFMAPLLMTAFTQMLLYSHAGQCLEDESGQVAAVAYDNIQWEYWPISKRKMFVLILRRAQQSCKISGVFFFVNIGSFVTVLRTAGSYVTLLWNLSNFD